MEARNKVIFVSDVHLSDERPKLTSLFLQFLEGPALDADALYILGDLFDVWVGEDLTFPFHQDIHRALKKLQANNVAVYFIPGNRDFLISSEYLKKLGCQKLADRAVIDLHSVPTLLMHGDLLCTQDKYYQWYRIVAQHPITRFLFLMLPQKTRQGIGRKLREKSRRYQQGKPLNILDVDSNSVDLEMLDAKALQFIHGHVHRANIHTHTVANKHVKRIVLGDWKENKGSFIISTPESTCLADFYDKDNIVIKQSYTLEEGFARAVA